MSLTRNFSSSYLEMPHLEAGKFGKWHPRRAMFFALLAGLAAYPGFLGELTRTLMVDAYVQVSVFVAATMLAFYGAERLFRLNIGELLKNSRAELPIAALLGATPGCGGAVIVVAAYTSGHASFGAVVAALTATMGDAAFLLIATRPDAAVVVLPLAFFAGIVTGWVADRVLPQMNRELSKGHCEIVPLIGSVRTRDIAHLAIALPGLCVGVSILLQVELVAIHSSAITVLGLAGAFLGLAIWASSPLAAMSNSEDAPVTRSAEETSFIGVWVISAFLLYEYLAAFSGLDLEYLFALAAPMLPLVGVIVGFIPGCGPQLLVTTLYINGMIPFAAIVGNSISNDGDALFPAIALNPKAAVLATLYSAVPALIAGYGFYFLAPGFMN